MSLILTTFESKNNCYGLHHTALYIGQGNEPGMVAYVPCPSPEDLARSLLELFCTKIAARFRNVRLYEQLREAYTRLEQKVEERTRELAEANNRLSALASTDAFTLADAMISAERLRAAVAISPINLNPTEISVTISLGVVQAESGETIEALMKRADNLLYTAKHSGRNCVCSAPLLT